MLFSLKIAAWAGGLLLATIIFILAYSIMTKDSVSPANSVNAKQIVINLPLPSLKKEAGH